MSLLALNLGGGAAAFDPALTTSIFDDFSWGNESNTPNGPFGFVPTGSAGGGIFTPANVTASLTNRFGVIGIGLGTSANSTADAAFFSDYALYYPGQASSATLQFSLNTPSALADVTNDYVIDVGFRSDFGTHAQAANAMTISYSRTLSANWMGYTSNNGSVTNVTTSDAALAVTASAWWNFKIVVTATTVSFYAAVPGAAWTLIGTSTTNLPDSTHKPFITGMIYKTSSFALQRMMAVDYVKFDATFSSAR